MNTFRNYAFLSIEMLWSIVIFGVVGITCMSVALHFTRFMVASSPSVLLDSHIASLRIQNLLSTSMNLQISPTHASFLLVDSQKLLGYGDKTFNANIKDSTLLPQTPLEILQVQNTEIIFSSLFTPSSFTKKQKLALLCQNALDSQDFSEYIVEVRNVGSDRIWVDSAPSSLCRVAIPLQNERIEITYSDTTIFLNQEILLENVSSFIMQYHQSEQFVSFRFCIQQGQKCFEGGSFVGAKAVFL